MDLSSLKLIKKSIKQTPQPHKMFEEFYSTHMQPFILVLLLVPVAAILLYPIAAFVMLARFYQLSAKHMVQCMMETVTNPPPPWTTNTSTTTTTATTDPTAKKKKRRPKKKKHH